LYREGHSYRQIAALLKTNYQAVYRAHQSPPANGTPITTLQRVEVVGEPVNPDVATVRDTTPDLKSQVDAMAADIAELKAHRLEVDAWLATLQAQSRDTAQTSAEVRSHDIRSLAQSSADPAQPWDNPEDTKSVPFNLSLPRGLKRLLDAEAKRTGLPASRLVQRLLTAALLGEGVRHDA
jgi:hypothetical protein